MASQSSLFQWAVPAKRAKPAASAAERRARRAAEAARLGLVWPPPAARKVGRPSRPQQWQGEIGRALLADRFSEVAEVDSLQPPAWYTRLGDGLVQPDVVCTAARAAAQAPRRACRPGG